MYTYHLFFLPSIYNRGFTTKAADPRLVPYIYIQSAWNFATTVVVFLFYTIQRWRKGRGKWNPTLTFINVVYISFISNGVGYIFSGSIIVVVLGDVKSGTASGVNGVIFAVPFIIALLYGRQKLFKVMARKFEDKRRGLDSAVIAELMNDPALRCGADWWTHHGKNLADEYPDPFDHRRNWIRAVIVGIEDSRFSINPNAVQQRLGVGFAQGGATARGGGGGSFFGGGRRRSRASNKIAPVPAALEWVTRSEDSKQDAGGLLLKAHDNLRTLDGQDLTRGLLAKCVVKREVVDGTQAVTLLWCRPKGHPPI